MVIENGIHTGEMRCLCPIKKQMTRCGDVSMSKSICVIRYAIVSVSVGGVVLVVVSVCRVFCGLSSGVSAWRRCLLAKSS